MQTGTTLDQDTIDLRFYWRQVRKRPGLILTVLLVSLTLGGLYVAKTRPVYRATTKLLIERDSSKVAPFQDLVPAGQTEADYETQYQIIQSRVLARRVIETLGLRTHPEFVPEALKPPVATQTVQAWADSLLEKLKIWISLPQDGAAQVASSANAIPDPDSELVDTFLRHLHVRSDPKVHLVNVSFDAHDPSLSASASNTLARLYIDLNLEMRFAALQDALDWLQNQVGGMRGQVEASEYALQRYKDTNNVELIDDRLPGLMQEITTLNAVLTRAKTERIELETVYLEIQRVASQGGNMEWMPAVVGNELIQQLKTRYVDLQRTAVQLGQKYGDEHPRVVQLQSQLHALQSKINYEIRNIVRAFKTQYQIAQARERELMGQIEIVRQEVKDLNDKGVQYGVLKREAESNRRLADLLLNRLKEATVSSDLTSGNNIRIIDPAEVPTKPVNIRPVITLTLAGMMGLVLGVGLVAFMGYLDNTLKTPEEAEEFLGLPVLGVIERFRRGRVAKEMGYEALVTIASPHGQVSEAFKTLRANLLFSYTDPPRKVFLVSSPHPHDGKTTVASNLAVVMAQTERRVLLVDADLRNPSLHRIFDVKDSAGLSELLLTERYDETIRVMDSGLSFVPAGAQPPNPSELLISQRMQRFLAFSREHYDMVLIDTPPLLAVSDAMVLSPLVDGILVVLRAGATPYDHARRAIAPFLRLPVDLSPTDEQNTSSANLHASLGLVMNFLDPREKSSYGYYGYHNYYYHRSQEIQG